MSSLAVHKNPAPASESSLANNLLKEWMGKKVPAQGRIYRAPGINMIEIRVALEY